MSASLRGALVVLGLFGLVAPATAQTIDKTFTCTVTSVSSYADKDAKLTVRCDTNGSVAVTTANVAPMLLTVKVPGPKPVNCVGAWGAWAEPPNGRVTNPDGSITVTEQRVYTVTTPAANGGTACPVANGTIEVRTSTIPATVPTAAIFPAQVTDPIELGTCSVADHDKWLRDGGDGFKYYTWHPQQEANGCRYGHEHGADPATVIADLLAHIDRHLAAGRYSLAQATTLRQMATAPILFGYTGRRMPTVTEPNGHAEAHVGFKSFIALYGECNDEGRCSKMSALHITHMGTGGVARFTMGMHSVESRQVHDSGAYQFTRGMFDAGTANEVCDPRQSPTRDFITINTSPCQINSPYEIWTMLFPIRDASGLIARFIATPATFDPITVHNKANPTEVVYAWDARVGGPAWTALPVASRPVPTRAFQGDDWSGFRGCDRESYAQPGVYERAGAFDLTTDSMGLVVPQGTVLGLRQVFGSPIVTANLRGATPSAQDTAQGNIGNFAYKVRRSSCALGLSLKN